jgi:steroid delta-isomerase-like uncharacterized protein
MLVDQLKDSLCRLYEAINRGDYPALDHLISDDYVEHEQLPPRIAPNREGIKEYVRLLHNAFPDIQYDIRDIIAEKDKVWSRVVMTGTQREQYDGIPATGRPVQIEQVDIYRFAQNKIIEHWSITDQLSLLQQLGVYAIFEGQDL